MNDIKVNTNIGTIIRCNMSVDIEFTKMYNKYRILIVIIRRNDYYMENTIGAVIQLMANRSYYIEQEYVNMENNGEVCLDFAYKHNEIEISVYVLPNGSEVLPTDLEDIERLKTTDYSFRVWNYAYREVLEKPTADELVSAIARCIT